MSKLTTALEVEKKAFRDRFFQATVTKNFKDYLEISSVATRFETLEDFLTASNLRILSAVEEWAREQSDKTGSKSIRQSVLSDLTSALQEARSNIK